MEERYVVYVKVNADGYITAANSSAFLTDATGWVEIDAGSDYRHYHAQNHYFPKSIRNTGGAYHYKLVNGKLAECTSEEIAEQEELKKLSQSSTLENRVKTLETDSTEIKEALEMLLSGVTE